MQCNIDIEIIQRRAVRFVTSNDTYKFSFYASAKRTWNSSPISVIPESLSAFKAIIAQCGCSLLFRFCFINSYIYLSFIILLLKFYYLKLLV